jgi:type II secretory ATPase GspE/PulE/Tfp pilus assembly ATPase PilB-like protein
MAIDDKSLRIALIFREASVLDEDHWQEISKRAGVKVEKGAWDILNQDASLSSIRDLLLLDLKTLIPGKTVSEIQSALAAPVKIFPTEITHILRANQPDVARLCHVLLSRNLITTARLEHALDRAERDALNVYEVLVAEQLLTPDNIEKIAKDLAVDITQHARVVLAGDILVYNSLVTREDYGRALDAHTTTHSPISRVLDELHLLNQQEIVTAIYNGLELPRVELITYDISPALLDRFPAEFMRRQLFLPLSQDERHLELGTADPFNLPLASTVSLLTGRRVSMQYTPHNDLLAKFEALFANEPQKQARPVPPAPVPRRRRAEPASSGDGKEQPESGARVYEHSLPSRTPEPFVDNLSTVQLVTQVIETAVGARATDIHIEPQADCVRIRYRVDGQLHSIMKVPTEMLFSIVSRIKVLASMNVTERRRPQDGHFSFETNTGAFDFRVSSLPSFYGEKIVLRVLDSSRVMTGLPELGLGTEQQKAIERLLARPHGLILVTGPTGSGKTSTLYACLSVSNREDVNIITIEDPVEYQLDGITQVQVDENIDVTFANGLRSALRQDPDVIMVGEIRDPETAHIAIRASLTGHLVFSTLHTNSALGALSSLAHMNVPQYLMTSAISGIIAQRLVRKICPECKKPATQSKAILKELGFAENTRKKFWKGEGCDHCFGSGFKGRTGIFEVVEMTEDLRRLILAGESDDVISEKIRDRTVSLFAAGVQKVQDGTTTPAEVLKAVSM